MCITEDNGLMLGEFTTAKCEESGIAVDVHCRRSVVICSCASGGIQGGGTGGDGLLGDGPRARPQPEGVV